MLEALKKIDLFPKATDEFRLKTTSGAIISIISILLMLVLFGFEVSYYLNTEVVDHLYVNTTKFEKMTVGFDISFPEVPCGLLTIDAADETGITQRDATFRVKKHKIDRDFRKLSDARRLVPGNGIRSEDELLKIARYKNETMCGNCYGAGKRGDCCNTCDEVRIAYLSSGWQFRPEEIEQCKDTKLDLPEELSEDGGCRIYGQLSLSQSSGHFHIVPHKVLQEAAGMKSGLFDFMELIANAFSQFNITHKIHLLHFGNSYPGLNYPLNDQMRNIADTHGMYQYYVKIVPTTYKELSGKEIISNQFAVTEHMRHLSPGSGRGLPGVYFNYEVSPISAYFEEKRGHGGFLRLFTSICAIVGGSFTLMGIVDTVIGLVGKVYSGSLL